MKRTPEQEAARRARRDRELLFTKCSCGNTASRGETQCSRCRNREEAPDSATIIRNLLEHAVWDREKTDECIAAVEAAEAYLGVSA